MPVYDAEAFVAAAIDSILGQTFRDFELLILDDGSTDRSVEIIRARDDSRIRLICNERRMELIRTLNRGVELARGKYIARMDADDISMPERLARQVAFLEADPDVGACGTWLVTMGDREGEVWRYPESAGDIRCRLLFDAALAHPTVCMRRDAFLRHGLRFDDAYPQAEDYQLWKRASAHFPLANLSEVLLRYRVHPASLSQRCREEQEATVRRIHAESLHALGIDPSNAELFVHRWVATRRPDGEALRLSDVGAWLEKLLRANADRGVYPRADFERLLGELWLANAYRAAASGRMEGVRFLRSPLARHIEPGQRLRWVGHALKRTLGLGARGAGTQRG